MQPNIILWSLPVILASVLFVTVTSVTQRPPSSILVSKIATSLTTSDDFTQNYEPKQTTILESTTQDGEQITTTSRTENPTSMSDIQASTAALAIPNSSSTKEIATSISVTSTTTSSTTENMPSSTTTATTSSTSTSTTSTSTTTTTSTTSKSTTTTTTTTTIKPPHECQKFQETYTKNESLFLNGKLINPTQYGNWLKGAGNLYLFGKTVVSWEINVRTCIDLDMTPLKLDSAEVKVVLDSFVNAWNGPLNYWTAGRRSENSSSTGTFNWCSGENSSKLLADHVRWQPGQPDNLGGYQNCLHLKILKNNGTAVLSDRNCSSKFTFACQKSEASLPAVDTYAILSCPYQGDKCVKNAEYFVNGSLTAPLKDINAHGIWRLANGRMFLFLDNSLSWDGAYKMCCALGMKLLSLDIDHKYASLIKAFNGENILNNASVVGPAAGSFWTSGTDQGRPGTFAWCSARKLFYKSKWAQGQPEASAQAQCVTIKLDANTAQLQTVDCASSTKSICESIDTRSSSTTGRALQAECAENFDIPLDVLDNVMEQSFANISVQMKCFIKCIGELSNTWTYGGLDAGMVLALIELASAGDEQKVLAGMGSMDACSQSKGMDECDTATRVMECGKNARPTIFHNMVAAVDSSPMVELPLPRLKAKCPAGGESVLNPALRDSFRTNTGLATQHGTVYTACGKKYYFSNIEKNWADTVTFCLSYGLKVLSLETEAEANCFAQTMGPYYPTGMIAWTSASKWMAPDNKFVWCPSGTRLLPNVTYANPQGGLNLEINYLLAIDVFSISNNNVYTYKYIDVPYYTARRTMCEEE